MLRSPPRPPPFPYTTLFRSLRRLLQTDARPEVARLITELQETATRLATLALAMPAPGGQDSWKAQVAELSGRHQHLEAELARLRSEEHTSELQSRGHLVCRL